MLKLGIVRRRDLQRPATARGGRRHTSVLLLRELARLSAAAADYDALVEQVRMPNKTWKFTCRGRFTELDALVLEILQGRYSPGARLTVFDLAASTGVTSVELYRSLARDFGVDFTASDLYRDVFTVRRGPWVGVFDAAGQEIQHVVGPFVLPAQVEESPAFVVNRLLKRFCRSVMSPGARTLLASVDPSTLAPFETVRRGAYQVGRLPLLSGDCLALLASDATFRFEAWDVTRPLPGQAHVVRAMNILTREHFSDAERARIIGHCVDATLPNGLLILGWSPKEDPKAVEATIYVVDARRLHRLASVNGGSEIDRFVEGILPVDDATATRASRAGRRAGGPW